MTNAPWTKLKHREHQCSEKILKTFMEGPIMHSCDMQDLNVSGAYGLSEHWPVTQLKIRKKDICDDVVWF